MCGAVTRTSDDLTLIWRPFTQVPADMIQRKPILDAYGALQTQPTVSDKPVSLHRFVRIENWHRFATYTPLWEPVLLDAQKFWEAYDQTTGCGYPFDLGPTAGLVAVLHTPLRPVTPQALKEAGLTPPADMSTMPAYYISILTKDPKMENPFEASVAYAHPGAKKRMPCYVKDRAKWLDQVQPAA